MQRAVVFGYNGYFGATEKDTGGTRLSMDFSICDTSSMVTKLFASTFLEFWRVMTP